MTEEGKPSSSKIRGEGWEADPETGQITFDSPPPFSEELLGLPFWRAQLKAKPDDPYLQAQVARREEFFKKHQPPRKSHLRAFVTWYRSRPLASALIVLAVGGILGSASMVFALSLYRYEHLRLGGGECVYRLNRLSGEAVLLIDASFYGTSQRLCPLAESQR